jgi:pimeloyl-ACP methyl ester carboxylesterase
VGACDVTSTAAQVAGRALDASPARPGALSATLNWYRAVDDDLQVPAGEVRVPTLYIWGENDMALGRGRRHENEGFRQSTL